MGSIVAVYAVGISDYALERDTALGTTAFATVVDTMKKLPEVERGILLTDRETSLFAGLWPEDFGPIVSRTFAELSEILDALRETVGEGETLFFIRADEPLLDPELCGRMFERHRRYFASYTFADGFPVGLAPEILRVETLEQLSDLASRHEIKPGRSMLFDLIQKDINAFDLETEIAAKDMRIHRILLAADTRRNFLLLNELIRHGARDADTVLRVVEEHPELLRTLPAYLQVQITEACPQSCSYCPYPLLAGHGETASGRAADLRELEGAMSLERWQGLLAEAHEFCDDLVIGIGLWGEPALHGEIVDFVRSVLDYPSFTLVVETSGVGWRADALRRIAGFDDGRIDWIVSLDAAGSETYAKLRGPQWEEAQAAVSMMRELFSDTKVHVQAVRMELNEGELEQFYRSWKKEEVPLIIQKYDHFCGFLPERKFTDLSPLERFPCFHLKRDLTVLLDGEVRICREDLRGVYSLGNIFEDGMEEVWNRMSPYYGKHISGELPELCGKCDEYYTFNF